MANYGTERKKSKSAGNRHYLSPSVPDAGLIPVDHDLAFDADSGDCRVFRQPVRQQGHVVSSARIFAYRETPSVGDVASVPRPFFSSSRPS